MQSIAESIADDFGMTNVYVSEAGELIVFMSSRAIGVLSVDNEYAIYELRIIDSVDFHVLTSIEIGGENSVIWEQDGWRFLLRSTIAVEYLRNMALSMPPNME